MEADLKYEMRKHMEGLIHAVREADNLVDYEELARRMNVSVSKVRMLVSERRIKPLIGDKCTVRFHYPSVLEQLRRR